MNRILSIAASDSGGGAGIQADIKTITLLGGYAMNALTAVTAQNTLGVSAVHGLPVSIIRAQIDAVMSDISANAVKTGMLLSAEIIAAVADALQHYTAEHLVVDPVMVSTSGHRLMEQNACEILRARLLPLAALVTPNMEEAAQLTGRPVKNIDDMQKAAETIHAMGPAAVLVKGGHLTGDCIDVLFDGRTHTQFKAPRIDTAHTHGTGCTLSAAIATLLGRGLKLHSAVQGAKQYLTGTLRHAASPGSGIGPVNHVAGLERSAQLYLCATALEAAFSTLQQAGIGRLIPEIQSNMGYAVSDAKNIEDVIAFPGRIIRLHGGIVRVASPAPGASRHIAKIILTAMRADGACRSAMNIAFTPAIVERCRSLGFSVGEFDRNQEPPDVKQREGSTLEWGTGNVIERMGRVPDIIFDCGDVGKEPVCRVLGRDPADVANKIIKIAEERS
jgi:hydroxymethylpyrimidine kinase / phosphomethylpyrimidine kinase / thiamine-phosphate diphosphorylase